MRRTARLARVLLIVAAALLSQGIAIFGGFVWDDRPLIVGNRLINHALPGRGAADRSLFVLTSTT